MRDKECASWVLVGVFASHENVLFSSMNAAALSIHSSLLSLVDFVLYHSIWPHVHIWCSCVLFRYIWSEGLQACSWAQWMGHSVSSVSNFVLNGINLSRCALVAASAALQPPKKYEYILAPMLPCSPSRCRYSAQASIECPWFARLLIPVV